MAKLKIPWMIAILHTQAVAISEAERTLYHNVRPVDKNECLTIIEQLPLRYYHFKYDSRGNDRNPQLGVIGHEVCKLVPEAVEHVAQRVFPNPEKGLPPITVTDLNVVDKNVLFMYNIGAIQALAEQQKEIAAELASIEQIVQDELERLGARLEEEASAEAQEALRGAQLKQQKAALQAEIAARQAEEEERLAELREEEEKRHVEQMAEEHDKWLRRQQDAELERSLKAIKAQEEIIMRREEMRERREQEFRKKELEQMEQLDEVRREGELEKTKAEAQARAEAERQNEDIVLRRIRIQAEEDRKRALETINLVVQKLSRGITSLLDAPEKLFMLVMAVVSFWTCYYSVREGLALIRRLMETRMGKPKLVRETSKTLWSEIMTRIQPLLRACHLTPHPYRAKAENVLSYFRDVVLPEDLRKQICRLAVATRNAKANSAPYRHLLLYGKPGTGKTMVAKRVAASSGMDYAIMSGGDVGPLGKDAVSELHRIFDWAQKSPRGLLLFIDEAETFLGARGRKGMSEERRDALNALLYQTGTQSYHFMMVLATNRPQDLDPAVLDRMDDYLGFPLPTMKERMDMLHLYFQELIVKRELLRPDIQIAESEMLEAAQATEGFSGREIHKLLLAVLNAVYGTQAALTKELFSTIVQEKAGEHKQKERLLGTRLRQEAVVESGTDAVSDEHR